MSLAEEFHAEHKARRARIAAKAFKQAVVVEIVPEKIETIQKETITKPDPLRALFCEPQQIGLDAIKRVVCQYFGISHVQMISPRRDKHLMAPRQIAIYLSRKLREDLSWRFIGNQFGNRDHSTIIHAVNKVSQLVKIDWQFAYDLAHIEAML